MGGLWTQLEGSLRKLGGPWSQLGTPWSQLGGPWSQLVGPAERPGGRGKEEKERKNSAFLVCGGTIGHRPLWGHCPKTTTAMDHQGEDKEDEETEKEEDERRSKKMRKNSRKSVTWSAVPYAPLLVWQ